jgi:hypothetical protein
VPKHWHAGTKTSRPRGPGVGRAPIAILGPGEVLAGHRLLAKFKELTSETLKGVVTPGTPRGK